MLSKDRPRAEFSGLIHREGEHGETGVWEQIYALVAAAQQRDACALQELCARFSPLIQASARRYRSARLHWDDLVQCGYEQLLIAIYTFDETRGVHFAHYAKTKVRGGLYSWVRAAERTDGRERLADTRGSIGGDGAQEAEESGWLQRAADEGATAAFAAAEWSDFFGNLSAREHLAIQATVIGDETTTELAARQGVGRESAKTWRKRGIAKMRHTWSLG